MEPSPLDTLTMRPAGDPHHDRAGFGVVPGLDAKDRIVTVIAVGGDPGGQASLVRSKVYLFGPDQDRYPACGPHGGHGGVQRQGAEHRLHDAVGQNPFEQVRVADEAG